VSDAAVWRSGSLPYTHSYRCALCSPGLRPHASSLGVADGSTISTTLVKVARRSSTSVRDWYGRGETTEPNKGMKLTRPVEVGASQLIPSVRRTWKGGVAKCSD
jgi:hypothetical protein